MENLLKEHDRLAKKQKISSSKVIASIEQLIEQAEKCKMEFAPPPTAMEGIETASGVELPSVPMETTQPNQEAERRLLLLSLQQSTKKTLGAIAAERKELNLAAAKYGKAIDKELFLDLEKASQTKDTPLNKTLLNQIIAEEFFCAGKFELGETFSKEAGVQVDPKLKTNLLELQEIRSALDRHEIQQALTWARTHRDQLRRMGSSLEFQLHRLQFIELLKAGQQREALDYARRNFPQFSTTHLIDIQKLMGSLVYAKMGRSSPYDYLFTADVWADVSVLFYRDCCALLSLPEQSPLLACVNAGALGLPILSKVADLIKARTAAHEFSPSTVKELPVQMDGPEFQYHNIFVCPVSREQSTPQNPPVMLPCGHVICWVSMEKLAKGSRFKCPYCPSEQFPNQIRVLTF